ncbi:TetR/AcrR family transcriptional regulator [Mycobacterium sp. MYCO198283]|uniref:TetR/AcrR family transcriptional regulator n=1 Tax=Mycobacterium sp. MYCO198283 TaxID=2883505 RepID=UPI001E31B6F5|nr:TetR/AcrR family transcriptional regulator [Mycobacterium sp. MYCO198283]MCG5434324.1 TetR/AcrR family transcriptional regulator [Mycobacterium sp. MYCO198283]
MSQPTDRPPDSTREQILTAAARQFARKAYSLVSLDDILREAQVTKGAMYFHFRSKYALALAIIDEHSARTRTAVTEILGRGLSGLETLIDVAFHVAVQDATQDMARAGLHLLESIGRTEELQDTIWNEWVLGFAAMVDRAIAEGDVLPTRTPEDISRLLVAMYAGVRQLSRLEHPDELIKNVEDAWYLVLPGITAPDRIDYFRQFVVRRSRQALRNAAVAPEDAGPR